MKHFLEVVRTCLLSYIREIQSTEEPSVTALWIVNDPSLIDLQYPMTGQHVFGPWENCEQKI